jgi:hypothetical protein
MMAFLRIMGSIALWYHGTKNNAKLPYPANFQKLNRNNRPPTASPARASSPARKK